MNCMEIGNIIRTLRAEKALTQKQLAEKLGVTDKAVSKWENGGGCPDLSLLPNLCTVLETDIETLLSGKLLAKPAENGNMKKTKFFVCPICGNIITSLSDIEVCCCSRKLSLLTAQKSDDINIEQVENDWYVTCSHPMTKDDYISFIAFAAGDNLQVYKQYPEWDIQLRIPKRGRGILFWHSTTKGLFYKYL